MTETQPYTATQLTQRPSASATAFGFVAAGFVCFSNLVFARNWVGFYAALVAFIGITGSPSRCGFDSDKTGAGGTHEARS